MVRVIIKARGNDIGDKILSVTRKCLELKDDLPCFGWEFFVNGGRMYFSAWYKDEDETGKFEFPISCVSVDRKYREIARELDELKWSALFWRKEEHE